MKKIKLLFAVVIFFSIAFSDAGEKPSFVIVVHKSVPIEKLSQKELSDIFLKKIRTWDNGSAIKPVDLGSASKVRETFSKQIHKRKISSIKAYWQKQIFTGKGVPPPEKNSDKEVLNYLAENRDTIGYISVKTKIDTNVVKIIELR